MTTKTLPGQDLGPQTNGKAWAAALTTFATMAAALFGFGEMPDQGQVGQAVAFLATSAVGAVVAGFMTWYKKNFTASVLVLCCVGILAGCATFYGAADTDQREGWRAVARYIYISTPGKNFASLPNPDQAAMDSLCAVDGVVFGAYTAVSDARAAGGDNFSAALAGLTGALGKLSLQVFGQISAPTNLLTFSGKTIIWVRVGAASIAEMRDFRKGTIQAKLAAFEDEDREPTSDEWDELLRRANQHHATIQAACQ